MPVEWLDQFGNISVEKITPEIISELDEPRQRSLLSLIDAADAKKTAGERMATARKRLDDAIADEAAKAQVHQDASAIIPFSVAKIEAELGRQLNAGEMREARRIHGVRCREILASRERQASITSYVPQQ
jgi:hypothetical protein